MDGTQIPVCRIPPPSDASTATQGASPKPPKDSMVRVGRTLKDLENSKEQKLGPIEGDPYSPIPLSEQKQVREEAPQKPGHIEENPY